MKTRTKLIYFLGGFATSALAIAFVIFLINFANGERGSGRSEERSFLVAAGKTQEKPEREPPKGNGRRD